MKHKLTGAKTRFVGHGRAAMGVMDLLADHAITLVAVSTVIVVASLPQVRNVVFQGVRFDHVARCIDQRGLVACLVEPPFRRALLFACVVACLSVAVVLLSILVVPKQFKAERLSDDVLVFYRRLFGRFETSCHWLRRRPGLRQIAGVPALLAERVKSRAWASLPFASAGILLGVQALLGNGRSAASLALAATTVAFAAWIHRAHDLARQHPGQRLAFGVEALGRYLFFVLVWLALGESFWFGARYGMGSYRLYTIWALTFLFFWMIASARLLEALPAKRLNPRLAAIVVVVSYLSFFGGASIETSNPTPPDDAEGNLRRAWMERLADRVEHMPDGPVVFVAASGGGSRAALFTALALSELARTGPHPGAASTYAANVGLVSAVSGGSLATARFLADLRDGDSTRPTDTTPRNFGVDEVTGPMLESLGGYVAHQRKCSMLARAYLASSERARTEICAGARHESAVTTELRLLEDVAVYAAVEHQLENIHERGVQPWFLYDAWVDAMAMDFMAPLLRGVITPNLERGNAVAGFWAENFQWLGFLQSSALDWTGPLGLFNASDVDRGRRIVVGYPPVPASITGESIESIGGRAGGFDIGLADAVRLSANFPWGFEVVHLAAAGAEQAERPSVLKLIDGGVVDNTGVDTLAAVIEGIERVAAMEDDELHTSAVRVRKQLARRGVVLLEIDSGAKPAEEHFLDSFPIVGEPVKAMQWAAQVNAENLKRANVARIEQAVESMGAAEKLEATTATNYIKITCDQGERVMTAWALGPEDIGKVLAIYAIESPRMRAKLERAFQEAAKVRGEVEAVETLDGTTALKAQVHVAGLEGEIRSVVRASNQGEDAASKDRSTEYERLAGVRPTPASSQASTMVARPGEAWVYVGHYRDQGWTTAYFEAPPEPDRLAGSVLVATGWSNMRTEPPNERGEFGRLLGALTSGDEVRVVDAARDWQGTGFIWARVRRE